MDHDKRIDKSITFVPVNIAILTVSDSRKADDDRSGDLLVGRVQEDGHNLAGRAIVTDDLTPSPNSFLAGLRIKLLM